MSAESLYRRLGKEAARVTVKTRTIKVFSPKGSKELNKALHGSPGDGRQAPWSYGEHRNRFQKKVKDDSEDSAD